MEKKQHLIYLDALRIIAILCVLFNHSGDSGYFYYTLTDSTVRQIISIAASSYCKIGVLLFFMISGVLLLNREESLSDIFKRRILKYVCILLIFSSARYVYVSHINDTSMNITELLRQIFTAQIYTPYWFLYTYLAFLASLPILRRLAHALSSRDYIYLFCLYIFSGGICGILARTFLGQLSMSFPIASDIIVYPLLGYFLAYRIPEQFNTRKMCMLFSGIGLLGIIMNICVTEYDYHLFLGWSEAGLLLFLILPCAATFFVVKYFFEHTTVSPAVRRITEVLGGCSFGIYTLEWLIKDLTGPAIQLVLSRIMSGMLLNMTYILCIYIAGVIIIWIFKHIPLIRKLF